MGKGSDQGGSSCLEPPFHFVGGVMDGWKNELVSEGRLVCLQTSAFPLWGPWPYFENWYRSLWLPTFWAGAGGSVITLSYPGTLPSGAPTVEPTSHYAC